MISRVAPDESVLGAQPMEHPLGSVALLARLRAVLLQPPLDELGEPVELRATDPHRAPIPWRHGILQHLPHALARDSEVLRRRALAQPLPARQAYLAIQLHGVNPPALPVTGKDRSGRVLLRRGGTIPPPPWSCFTPPFAHQSGVHRTQLLGTVEGYGPDAVFYFAEDKLGDGCAPFIAGAVMLSKWLGVNTLSRRASK